MIGFVLANVLYALLRVKTKLDEQSRGGDEGSKYMECCGFWANKGMGTL
jgi:hypothetical protein